MKLHVSYGQLTIILFSCIPEKEFKYFALAKSKFLSQTLRLWYNEQAVQVVRQRNSIFLKKRAIASIENVFVYSDRYGHSDLKSD